MRIIFTYIALIAFLGQSYAAEKRKVPLNITITNIEPMRYDVKPQKVDKFKGMKNVTVNTIVVEDKNAPTNPDEFEIYKLKKIKGEKLKEIKANQNTISKIRMANMARRKNFRAGQIDQLAFDNAVQNANNSIKKIKKASAAIQRDIDDLDFSIDYLEHPEKYPD